MSELYDDAYHNIVQSALEGTLTFFLGAGANLSGRPDGVGFELGKNLPSGEELARALAHRFGYPSDRGNESDLIKVAQFASVSGGQLRFTNWLLERVFQTPFPPTPLHSWIAAIPARIRAVEPEERDRKYPLVITANYDDSLEQAFDTAKEPYDLVAYHREGLLHWVCEPDAPRGEAVRIETDAKDYVEVDPDRRTVILNLHGLVDRVNRKNVSFVITEDHYIDYLTRLTPSKLLPPRILERMLDSDFLFLGYSLRDWNVRAILKQIWDEQAEGGSGSGKYWAVLKKIEPDDAAMWQEKKVAIVKQPLDEFVYHVQAKLDSLSAPGVISEAP